MVRIYPSDKLGQKISENVCYRSLPTRKLINSPASRKLIVATSGKARPPPCSIVQLELWCGHLCLWVQLCNCQQESGHICWTDSVCLWIWRLCACWAPNWHVIQSFLLFSQPLPRSQGLLSSQDVRIMCVHWVHFFILRSTVRKQVCCSQGSMSKCIIDQDIAEKLNPAPPPTHSMSYEFVVHYRFKVNNLILNNVSHCKWILGVCLQLFVAKFHLNRRRSGDDKR